ncbi:hypothetical protein LCGC14_1015200, partial [marine sediment metagenome]
MNCETLKLNPNSNTIKKTKKNYKKITPKVFDFQIFAAHSSISMVKRSALKPPVDGRTPGQCGLD